MNVLKASLKHFTVQTLGISNKAAIAHIVAGRVLVNGQKGLLEKVLLPEDVVTFEGRVLKEAKPFIYLAYYKPRGIESTLNPDIPGNLRQALDFNQRLFPVGRLDKESEGLMLLTDDGVIYDRILHADHHQEKEYLVTVNQPLTAAFLNQLAAGVVIMGQKTRPARVQPVGSTTFRIVLTQGRNRQIRRMCYKLGCQVLQLVRVRMITLELGDLPPGTWRHLRPEEVAEMKSFL